MGAPQYTSRLAIPYPADYDDDWYDSAEQGAGKRMDKLDELLAIALENPMLKTDASRGSLSLEESGGVYTLYVRGDDLVIRSARGGDITFAMDSGVVVTDSDFIWFVPAARPIAAGATGTMVAGPVAPWNAVVIGWFWGGKGFGMHAGIWGGR